MTRTLPTQEDSSDTETEFSNIMSSPNNSQRPRDRIEQLEWLIHLFFEAVRKPWFNIKRLATYVMVDCGGYKTIDETVQWLVRNPLSSFILVLVSLISLPFLLLVGFGVSIIAITFTGLLVLEGTLLSFVSVVSFGCLGAFFIVLSIIATLLLVGYMGFTVVYDMYGKDKITALANFMKKEPESDNQAGGQSKKVSKLRTSTIDSVGSASQQGTN